MADAETSILIGADTAPALAELQRLKQQIERTKADINVGIDTAGANVRRAAQRTRQGSAETLRGLSQAGRRANKALVPIPGTFNQIQKSASKALVPVETLKAGFRRFPGVLKEVRTGFGRVTVDMDRWSESARRSIRNGNANREMLRGMRTAARRAAAGHNLLTQSSRDTSEALEGTGTSAQRAATRASNLTREGQASSNMLRGMANAGRKAATGQSMLSRRAKESTSAVASIKSSLSGFNREGVRSNAILRTMGKNLDRSIRRFRRTAIVMGTTIGTVVALADELAKLGAIAAGVFVNIQFADAQRRLESFTSTAEEASGILDDLRSSATDVGANFLSMEDAAARFVATAQTTNLTIGDSKQVFRDLLEVTRGFGLSSSETRGVLEDFTEVLKSQRVSLDDLADSFSFLNNENQRLAQAFGLSVERFRELRDEGFTLSRNVIPALATQFRDLGGDTEGIAAQFNRLINTASRALQEFNRAGVIRQLRISLQSLQETAGGSTSFMRSLGQASVRLIQNFEALVVSVKENWGQIVTTIRGAVGALIGAATGGVPGAIMGAIIGANDRLRESFFELVGEVTGAFRGLITGVERAENPLTRLVEGVLASFINSLREVVEGLRAMTQAFSQGEDARRSFLTDLRDIVQLLVRAGAAVGGAKLGRRLGGGPGALVGGILGFAAPGFGQSKESQVDIPKPESVQQFIQNTQSVGRLQSFRQRVAAQQLEVQRRIQQARGRLGELREGGGGGPVGQRQPRIEAAQSQIDSLQKKAAIAQETLAILNARIETLQTGGGPQGEAGIPVLSGIEGDLARAQTLTAEIARQNDSLKERIKDAKDELDVLRTRLQLGERAANIEEARLEIQRQFPLASKRERQELLGILRAQEKIKKQLEAQQEIEQALTRAAENVQDAFADSFETIFRGGIDGFEDFADQILDIMTQTAAQIAAVLTQRIVFGLRGVEGLLSGSISAGGGGFVGTAARGLGLVNTTQRASGGTGLVSRTAQGLGLTATVGGPSAVSAAGAGGPGALAQAAQAGPQASAATGGSVGALGAAAGGLAAGGAGFLGGKLVGNAIGGGGAGQALGSAAGGAATGAAVGSVVPGIGTAIGAVVGGLAGLLGGGGLFGDGSKDTESFSLFSGWRIPDVTRRGVGGPFGAGRRTFDIDPLAEAQTPFGRLAIPRAGGERGGRFGALEDINNARNQTKFAGQVLEAVQKVDRAIAEGIQESEFPQVKEALTGRFESKTFGQAPDRDAKEAIADLLRQRFVAALEALGAEFRPEKGIGGEKLGKTIGQFFQQRTQLQKTVDQFTAPTRGQGPLERMNQGLDQVEAQFESIMEQVGKFGVDVDRGRLREARGLRKERIRERFIGPIRASLDELLAPTRGPVEELDRALQSISERFAETAESARLFGVDFNETELRRAELLRKQSTIEARLNNLTERRNELRQEQIQTLQERRQGFGQAREGLQGLLFEMTGTPESPLAPRTRLANARQRAQGVLQRARGGDVEAAQRFPEVGRNLLDVARNVFASGPEFFEQFRFVRQGAQDLRDRAANRQAQIQAEIETLREETQRGNEVRRQQLEEQTEVIEGMRDRLEQVDQKLERLGGA